MRLYERVALGVHDIFIGELVVTNADPALLINDKIDYAKVQLLLFDMPLKKPEPGADSRRLLERGQDSQTQGDGMNHQVTLDVDREHCARDGLCVRECPLDLLELDEDDFPRVRKAAERLCIGCGHCVAVCPKAALCLNGRDPETLKPVDRSWRPAPEKLRDFLAARRSTRSYKPEPLERGEVKSLLDAARFAPTAMNSQPMHWTVTLDPKHTRELAGLTVDWMKNAPDMPYKGWLTAWYRGEDKILHNAPHILVAHASEVARWPLVDCVTAVAWVEIMAWAMGLGTCWAGIFTRAAQQWTPLQKALALPEGHTTQAAVMLGRPVVRYNCIPERLPLRIQWL